MSDFLGRKLGNYQIMHLLGQGGFADVYLGEHIHLKTFAAIKVLRMRLDKESLESFLAEARIIAHLEHPHIIRVLEFGVEDNVPYLVMSYAPNGTMRQRYPKGTLLPQSDIVAFIKQVASALQYAHDQRLIHRDIKPENMLLGRQGEILLSDFGIALIAQSSRYHTNEDVIGTVAYMAPEQLQGKPGLASDQYALAIVIYEWLCGERPFQGTFLELFSQHMAVPPPSLHMRFPFIPQDIEDILFIALAKQPENRFGSVKAFANALEQAYKVHGIIASDALTEAKNFVPPPPPALKNASNSFSRGTNAGSPQHTGTISPIPTNALPNTSAQANQTSALSMTTGSIPPGAISQQQSNTTLARPAATISSIPGDQAPKGKVSPLSKVLSIAALVLIVVAVSSYFFNIPPSPFSKSGSTPQSLHNGNANKLSSSSTSGQSATALANNSALTASAVATESVTVTPTPPTYTPGQTIYKLNNNWSKWTPSSEWKSVSSTTFGSDGSDDGSSVLKDFIVWAPNVPLPQNYAVEAQVTYVKSTIFHNQFEMGIILRGDGNTSGYEVGMASRDTGRINPVCGDAQGNIKAIIAQFQNYQQSGCNDAVGNTGNQYETNPNALTEQDFPLDNAIHTYRAEVNGNDITFSVDGRKTLEITDNSYLSAGQVGFRSVFADVNVTGFTVTAL